MALDASGWAFADVAAMSDLSSTHRAMPDIDYLEATSRCCPDTFGRQWGLIPARASHIPIMAHWQASITRAPPKTKAELRQMLTEAVRNTQDEAADGAKQPPKAKKGHG